MTKKFWCQITTPILLLMISLSVAPALAWNDVNLAPHIPAKSRNGTVGSLNWSGYAVTGPAGSVTNVKGSWVVPAVQCSGGENSYSSFWVGIDGFSSNTVEQIGTDSDCRNGAPVYYAWYEFYPRPAFRITDVKVNPGNVISAQVNYLAGMFISCITNVSTSQFFCVSARVGSAQRSSAEWIAEAPSSGGSILPMAKFGTVAYGLDNTSVSATCYATVNGVTGKIGSFGSAVQQITMVTSAGVVKAQPSTLSSDQTSFTVAWRSSGP